MGCWARPSPGRFFGSTRTGGLGAGTAVSPLPMLGTPLALNRSSDPINGAADLFERLVLPAPRNQRQSKRRQIALLNLHDAYS